jgi:cysteine desulfurase
MSPSKSPIYLDYHATTPLDPRVLDAMMPLLAGQVGNPSSSHAFGIAAADHVEKARLQVAALIGAQAREILFTSGATEANNLAIKGAAVATPERRHIITVATEHHAVLQPCRRLVDVGYELDVLPVDSDGLLDPAAVVSALRDDTLLVSVGLANGEIGTIMPVAEIAAAAHARGALMHSDAAQAAGRIPVDAAALGLDLMSISGHKLNGPMGIGALFVRRDKAVRLTPVQDGGGQERGLRSGTLNVPGAVGLGSACAIAAQQLASEGPRLRTLRDQLLAGLSDLDIEVNGTLSERLPGNLNIRFSGVPNDALMANCPGLAISAGSACASGTPEPSHVLTAIGCSPDHAEESVRFGLGRFTQEAEIDEVILALRKAVTRIRSLTSDPPGVLVSISGGTH